MFINGQSPERKKQIYEKLLQANSKVDTIVECEYLMSLCEELDEYSVYQYYFKPILQDALNALFTGDMVFNTFNYFVDMYRAICDNVEGWYVGIGKDNILDTLIPFSLYEMLEIGKVSDLAVRALWELEFVVHDDNISYYEDYKDQIHRLYINGGVIDAVYGLKHRIEKYMEEMDAKLRHRNDFVLDLLQ